MTRDLLKVEFLDKSKDIFDLTERGGVVKERSDGDERPPPTDPKGFNHPWALVSVKCAVTFLKLHANGVVFKSTKIFCIKSNLGHRTEHQLVCARYGRIPIDVHRNLYTCLSMRIFVEHTASHKLVNMALQAIS